MLIAISLLSLILLLILFYQDARERSFSVFLIIGLLPLFIGYNLLSISFEQFCEHILFNLAFTLLNLLMLTAYFSIKNKRLVNIADTYLGWGDILLFLLMSFLLSPVNYLSFFFFVPFLILSFIIFSRLFRYKTGKEIPLAGIQSAGLAVFFSIALISDSVRLNNDQWILSLVSWMI
jgi:hypothetical protein